MREGKPERATGYTLGSGPVVAMDWKASTEGSRQGWNQQVEGREDEGMTAKVTVEEVERVAELAHLELKPEEVAPMLGSLNAILDYIAELNELDTTGIAPLAQVSELGDGVGVSGPRADLGQPSLDRAIVMHEAPETDQVFFEVPKVIER